MLNVKLLFLGIGVFAMVGCNEKLPYIPDFDVAVGVVIGSEHCKRELVKNAWLIQFKGPNPLNKTYGDDIILQNTSYSNVVKVYDLPDSAKIIGQRYAFEFNIESNSSATVCDATNPVTFNIKTIRLKRISRIAN